MKEPALSERRPDASRTGGNEGGFEARRSELSPDVRIFSDRLYVRIQDIYKKYGVASVAELHANVASGQKPKNLKSGELKSDVEELSKLQDRLEFALENDKLPDGEDPGLVILHDIPTFEDGLPSAATFKDVYKFYGVWGSEYREGRSAGDFVLTEDDLKEIGFDDPERIRELLVEMTEARENMEPVRMAKVFSINGAIAKKKEANPAHPDWLTTKEVLEVIHEAGFRPATLEELLAFGKEHWEPGIDDEMKAVQHTNSHNVCALGSSFSDSGGLRYAPSIYGKRYLGSYIFYNRWRGDCRFLVLSKLSS